MVAHLRAPRLGLVRSSGLTEAQAARRERMVDTTLVLAIEGGWDAVQMREVAARADVAIGTLYRYFPSKENLLVSVMLDQIRDLAGHLAERPSTSGSGAQRVDRVLSRANRSLQAFPMVTTAMIRALVSGNTDVAPVVSQVRDEMRDLLATAFAGGTEVSGVNLVKIDLLNDVWLATLVSWISGTVGDEAVSQKLSEAVEVLLGNGQDTP